MTPVWKLLKSKQNDEERNPTCRGALRSALAGRQYPQVRVFVAGWSEHNRCVLCLNNLVQADLTRGVSESCSSNPRARAWCGYDAIAPTASTGFVLPREVELARTKDNEQHHKSEPVIATADQISRAPIGSNNHRIWKCQAGPMKEARAKWTRADDRTMEASCDTSGHPVWERGFTPQSSKFRPSPPFNFFEIRPQ